jgi:hypothetical protein
MRVVAARLVRLPPPAGVAALGQPTRRRRCVAAMAAANGWETNLVTADADIAKVRTIDATGWPPAACRRFALV